MGSCMADCSSRHRAVREYLSERRELRNMLCSTGPNPQPESLTCGTLFGNAGDIHFDWFRQVEILHLRENRRSITDHNQYAVFYGNRLMSQFVEIFRADSGAQFNVCSRCVEGESATQQGNGGLESIAKGFVRKLARAFSTSSAVISPLRINSNSFRNSATDSPVASAHTFAKAMK